MLHQTMDLSSTRSHRQGDGSLPASNRHLAASSFQPPGGVSGGPRHSTTSRHSEADEVASVSSMSSTSRAIFCRKCGEVAVDRVKPLVQCVGCNRKWHPICHRPPIETRFGEPVTSDWRCQRCQEKLKVTNVSPSADLKPDLDGTNKAAYQITANHSFNSFAPVSRTLEPNKPASSILKGSVDNFAFYSDRTCEKIGCTRPVVQKSGIDNWKAGAQFNRLCKQHEMEEQHKRASAKRADLTHQKRLPPIRPFNKKKLYKKSTSARQSELMDDDLYQMGRETLLSTSPIISSPRITGDFQVNEPSNAGENLDSNMFNVSITKQSQSIHKTSATTLSHTPSESSPSGQLHTSVRLSKEQPRSKRRELLNKTNEKVQDYAIPTTEPIMLADTMNVEIPGPAVKLQSMGGSQKRKFEVTRSEKSTSSKIRTIETSGVIASTELELSSPSFQNTTVDEHRESVPRPESVTPPRPKLPLPAWQLQKIADAAARNGIIYGSSEQSPPPSEPRETGSAPQILATSQPERVDHYSPSYQLESEFRASGVPIHHSSSTLTSLATTPVDTSPTALEGDDGITSTTLREVDVKMIDVDDGLPAERLPAKESLDTAPAERGPRIMKPIETFGRSDRPHPVQLAGGEQQRPRDRTSDETEKYKRRYMKVIGESWGQDFYTKLPAWPDPPGKTFLEHLIKLCKTEKILFNDFKQGITAVFNERTVGKDPSRSKRWDQFIKISDVKEFLARYQNQHNISAGQDGIENETHLDESSTSNNSRITDVDNHEEVSLTYNTYQPHEDTSRAKMPQVPERLRRGQQVSSIAETIIGKDIPLEPITPQLPPMTPRLDGEPSTPATCSVNKLKVTFKKKRSSGTGGTPGTLGTPGTPPQQQQHSVIGEPMMPIAAANSLEAKRQQKAASFDESALDSFLYKGQSTTTDGSAWDHIDPRTAWPKAPTLTEDFLATKRANIEARGSRKSASRYGKALTPEVIKHRKEMGWQKHQNKEASEKWKNGEDAGYMEELFGLPDPATLEPVLKEGKLHMSEKSVDENGKQRRKAAIRTWPVLSAN